MFDEAQIIRRTDDANYLDKFVLISVQEHGTLNIVKKVEYLTTAKRSNLKILDEKPTAEQVHEFRLKRAARKRELKHQHDLEREKKMELVSNAPSHKYTKAPQKNVVKTEDALKRRFIFSLKNPANADIIKEAISLINEGYVRDVICSKLNLSPSAVMRIAKTHGLKIHYLHNELPEKYRDKGSLIIISKLLAAGMRVDEIAKETNLTPGYIYSLNRAFQLEARVIEERNKKSEPKTEHEVQVVEDKLKHKIPITPTEISLNFAPVPAVTQDQPASINQTCVDYVFPLSDGRKISIQIPTNLTDREAQRFGQFVASLVV